MNRRIRSDDRIHCNREWPFQLVLLTNECKRHSFRHCTIHIIVYRKRMLVGSVFGGSFGSPHGLVDTHSPGEGFSIVVVYGAIIAHAFCKNWKWRAGRVAWIVISASAAKEGREDYFKGHDPLIPAPSRRGQTHTPQRYTSCFDLSRNQFLLVKTSPRRLHRPMELMARPRRWKHRLSIEASKQFHESTDEPC